MYRRLKSIKRKRFVQIVSFLLICESVVSQTFETIYRTDNDDISVDAIEINSRYIISVNSGDYFSSNYESKIFILNFEGDFLDSIEIQIPSGYTSSFIRLLKEINDTSLLCLLVDNSDYYTGDNLQFINFTKDLIIQYDTIQTDSLSKTYTDFYVTDDNKIISVGSITEFEEHFISINDLKGNNIGFNSYFVNFGAFPITVIDIPQNNIYSVYMGFSNERVFFDINKETLLIEKINHYPYFFNPRNAISGITDSSYFVAGNDDEGFRKISYLEMNNNGDTIRQMKYFGVADTNSFYFINSICTNSNNLFLGGSYNYNGSPPPQFYPERRWIFINKLNPDGSIVWQRFYKGEVNYMPTKVLATSDGGALILSGKYDWNDPIPYQRDLHILKVDSTGWYEGLTTGETEYDRPKQILVYPNPAKDKINFVTGLYNNLELSIYNLQGKEMIKQHLPHNQSIDLSDLPNGLYLYLITGKNGFVEKGKLIKE